MSEYAFEAARRSSASISWSFATQTLPQDTGIPFSNVVGAPYQGIVAAAFDRWASVSGLTFSQVTDSASVPIRIGFDAFTRAGELGETDFRYAHGLLGTDTLIRLLDPASAAVALDASGAYSYDAYGVTLFQVALHEIGHALGLGHTTDPTTIMFPYASSTNRDLAEGDVEGINTLYPYYTVAAAAPVQVASAAGQTDTYDFTITRYSDPAAALTIGYAITGAPYPSLSGSVAADPAEFGGGAYPSGQVTFAAGSTTATLSIAVANSTTGHSDEGFALALSSLNPADSVTVRGQINALILDNSGYGQVSGNSLGIYRFFDSSNGTHFYSASEAERNTLVQTRPALVYEGLDLTAVATPSADQAAAPVYRFFDLTNGSHFYSVSGAERDAIQATRPTLVFEGVAFYEHAVPQAGDTPIYRFFDAADGTHFFTASAPERASILATRPDLHDEGIGFYAPSA